MSNHIALWHLPGDNRIFIVILGVFLFGVGLQRMKTLFRTTYPGARILAATVVTIVCFPDRHGASAEFPRIEWISQVGSTNFDWVNGLAVGTDGRVYVSGYSEGRFGQQAFGSIDAIVSVFEPEGTLERTHQFGTSAADSSNDIAVDQRGNIYVVGGTTGNLGRENPAPPSTDAFLAALSENGATLWMRQFGSDRNDSASAVAVGPSGDIFVAGRASPTFLETTIDAFVSRFDVNGGSVWTRAFGSTAAEDVTSIAVDTDENIIVGGSTLGNLGAQQFGRGDAFVAKVGASGDLLWTSQFGTDSSDRVSSVSTDALGNIYIAGDTLGSLAGPSSGLRDAFVAKLAADGEFIWLRQFGENGEENARGISVDELGNLYVTGAVNSRLCNSSSVNCTLDRGGFTGLSLGGSVFRFAIRRRFP